MTETDGPVVTGRTIELRRGVARRQRRDMGLTLGNVRSILLDMGSAGMLDGRTCEAVAADVLEQLQSQNQSAFLEAAGNTDFDWDAFMEFLERLIEILMVLLPIFL
jgi:hypothetical protein